MPSFYMLVVDIRLNTQNVVNLRISLTKSVQYNRHEENTSCVTYPSRFYQLQAPGILLFTLFRPVLVRSFRSLAAIRRLKRAARSLSRPGSVVPR